MPAALTSPLQMNCCSRPEKPSCCELPAKTSPWLKTVDLVCRVAIGLFAAFQAPISFAFSLSLGLLIGAAYAITRLYQNKPLFPEGQGKPVCAQGYMEFLSGMRFPPHIGSVATTAFIAAHMRHDPQFYVPFCGLFLGFCLGIESATLAYRRFIHLQVCPKT